MRGGVFAQCFFERCKLLIKRIERFERKNRFLSVQKTFFNIPGSGTVVQARIHTPVSIDLCHPKRRRATRATESLGRRSSFVNRDSNN